MGVFAGVDVNAIVEVAKGKGVRVVAAVCVTGKINLLKTAYYLNSITACWQCNIPVLIADAGVSSADIIHQRLQQTPVGPNPIYIQLKQSS